MTERAPVASLTDRQREVLELIAAGKTNFEIATDLGITLDGAKWHVREIMAKLGCDTREEAVAAWRRRQSVTSRMKARAARGLGLLATRAGRIGVGLTASVGMAVSVALLFAAQRADGNEADPDEGAPTSLATATTDQAIAFRSCGTGQFTRPSIAEMADVFQNPRFSGAGGNTSLRPAPPYFAYYLRDVYQIIPRAISANIESVALSGSNKAQSGVTLIPPSAPCDQAFRQDVSLNYYDFWFVDMVPQGIDLQGDTLTIQADLLPGSMTDFVFPDPPLAAPTNPTKDVLSGLPRFKELRVVDGQDHLLYSEGSGGTVQYSADGSLMFATNGFGGGHIEFDIRGRPQAIAIYWQASRGMTQFQVTDGSGRIWASDQTLPAPETWSEVFRKELPVGHYVVTAGLVLVVPTDTPLP